MRCKSAQPLLSRYLDQELGSWRRRGLERHLEGCDSCRCELAAARRVWELLGEVEPVEAPEILGRLEARLNREQFAQPRRRQGRLSPVAFLAAVLLFAAAGSAGGIYAADSRPPAGQGAAEAEYAELLGDLPAGLDPVAAILQPARTR